jgi:hypothetical protein
MSGRHAPNSWDSYLAAHNGRLADFADHFLERDTLTIKTSAGIVAWSGALYCRDGIEIQVARQQRTWMRSGRRWVETIEYSYHVMVRARGAVRSVFGTTTPIPTRAMPTLTIGMHTTIPATTMRSAGWAKRAGRHSGM